MRSPPRPLASTSNCQHQKQVTIMSMPLSCFLPEICLHMEQWLGESAIFEAIPLGMQTSILSWIHVYITLNLMTVTFVNSPQMSLPNPCMHLAMQMATNTFCLTHLSITKVTGRPSGKTISGLSTTVATHFADSLLDGICVSSGRMDPPPANPSRI